MPGQPWKYQENTAGLVKFFLIGWKKMLVSTASLTHTLMMGISGGIAIVAAAAGQNCTMSHNKRVNLTPNYRRKLPLTFITTVII